MTKEEKQKVSNRLVINFGMLLFGAFMLLYVRNALMGIYRGVTFTILLVLGVLCLLGSAIMFFMGKKGNEKLKNFSAMPFGVFAICIILYFSSLELVVPFTWQRALALVYILMAVYFIIISIFTYILLRKPTIKPVEEREILRRKYAKKKRKK